MGQQQLLLIVLGIIIVSIAIFVGINLFRSNAIEAKRNNVANELVNLAAMAQQYYIRPTTLGGGGNKFTNWKIPGELKTTANGSFKITDIQDGELTILGTGNEVVTGNDSVKVEITVYPKEYEVKPLN